MLRFLILLIGSLFLVACQNKKEAVPALNLKLDNSYLSCNGKVKDLEVEYDANYVLLESAIPTQ